MIKRSLMTASLALLYASGAQAAPIVYVGVLTGDKESPQVSTPATGSALVAYDPVTRTGNRACRQSA